MIADVGDAKALNNFAWALLTQETYGAEYNDVAASPGSQRGNADG